MPRTPIPLLLLGSLLLVAAATAPRWSDGVPGPFELGFLYVAGFSLLVYGIRRLAMRDGCDEATPRVRQRYFREFFPGIAAYVVGVLLSAWLLRQVDAPALRTLIALMPVPGIVFAMRALVRYIRDVDEMQQRIELEAVSIATAVVSVGYLTAGFLQAAHVINIPAVDAMIWVFPLICLVYGLMKAIVARRYR